MEDKDISLDKMWAIQRKYMDHFMVEKAPIFIMMQSTESYIEELEQAIKNNKPIDEDGYGRPQYDIAY